MVGNQRQKHAVQKEKKRLMVALKNVPFVNEVGALVEKEIKGRERKNRCKRQRGLIALC